MPEGVLVYTCSRDGRDIVHVLGPCFRCGQPFTYHPNHVPSAIIAGVREPLCRDCMTTINALRVSLGLPAVAIMPDAYQPMPASEL